MLGTSTTYRISLCHWQKRDDDVLLQAADYNGTVYGFGSAGALNR
jgi:hypothetical protein